MYYVARNKLKNIEVAVKHSFRSRYPFFIIFVHFCYAWTELGTFFGTLTNQTFNVFNDLSQFSYGSITSFSYRRGLFLGGLFFDFFFRATVLIGLERVLLKFRYPPIKWKQEIHRLTRYFIVSLSFRRIPYYGSDYLSFSSLGFFGRDTELRRIVSRSAFDYSIVQGRVLSILFEGRNVIGEDGYGRPSPDILHRPWQISRLAIEVKRDLVDETYRTQQTNQRVDSVYLGTLERKIFEWLTVRNPKNPTSDQVVNDQNKKAAILVKEPIRKGVGANVTPRGNFLTRKLPRIDFERFSDRLVRWFRAARYTKNRGDKRLFGLPSGYAKKVPESLFALFTTDFSQQSYLTSIGILEPQRVIRYSNSIEFTRKQNARRSPLHRRPISRYIDLFLRTRSKIKGFSSDISTRRQQRDLYHARRILHNYITSSRRYVEIERISPRVSNFSNGLVRRITWQSKFHSYLFGGNRSRSSSIYSQQYVGNLQLVRRLFSISWSSNENVFPSRIQRSEKQFLRRKIALDQNTFDKQKTAFEHEELGKTFPLQIQSEREQKHILNSVNPLETKIGWSGSAYDWFSSSKKRSFPDSRVRTTPLYVGWDHQKHSVILCNRFLPLEWSIRTKLFNKTTLPLKNFEAYRTKEIRSEYRIWPKNFQTRRMRIRGRRYDIRAFLRRRIPVGDISSLLSQDRSVWRRKTGSWDASIFAFWFNPRSDIQREGTRRSYNPIRGSQRFPLSLDRRIRPRTYILGDLQPATRGGFVWPGTDIFTFVQKNYHRLELIIILL
jgi:hypothetical protein